MITPKNNHSSTYTSSIRDKFKNFFSILVSNLIEMQLCLIKEFSIKDVNVLKIDLSSIQDIDYTSLTTNEIKSIESIQLPKRKKEIYGSILLKNHLFPKDEILKNPLGAPFLKNNKDISISISHTDNYLLLAYSSFPIGIDIEKTSSKVLKVTKKFVNQYEEEQFDNNSEEEMTTIWTMKEVMYKLANERNINFKENIVIELKNNIYYGQLLLSDKNWYQTEIHTFVEDDHIISLNIQPLVQK